MKTKKSRILFMLLCIFLLTVLSAAVIRSETAADIEPIAPQVNADGLCHPIKVVAEQAPSEPQYKMYFDEADVVALAQMLWGEARGCTIDNQMKAVWCVLNRVDDPRFPDTIIGVVSAPSQFHGYSPYFPVWDNLKDVARDVLTRWSLEKQGVCVNRELPKSYLWFTGNGVENIFREAY